MMRKYYAYEDDLNMLPPNPLEPTMFTVYLAAEVDAALAEKNARIAELEAALAEVTAHLEAHTAIRPLNPLQRWTITGEEPDEDDMPCGTMAAPDPEGQWVAIGDVHKLGVAFDELTKESERLRTNCTESATRQYADKLSMDRDMLEADNHEKDARIAELEQERDQAVKVRAGYDAWLSAGVYYTNAEFHAHTSEHKRQLAERDTRIAELEAVLRSIAQGAGAYNQDPFQHCLNCLEDAKSQARHALTPKETP